MKISESLIFPSGVDGNIVDSFIKNTLGNNFELLHDIVAIYLQETPDFLDKILQSTKDKNYYEAQSSAHNLKSNSATLGAMRIRELAEILENDCIAKKYARVLELHRELDKEFQVVKPHIEALLQRNS